MRWSLAVLKTSHIAAHVHDKYDVPERIDSRRFDSWSGDALAEVIAGLPDEPEDDDPPAEWGPNAQRHGLLP
jgi:hypothetical protein